MVMGPSGLSEAYPFPPPRRGLDLTGLDIEALAVHVDPRFNL